MTATPSTVRPVVGVGAVVWWQNHVLLIRRRKPPLEPIAHDR